MSVVPTSPANVLFFSKDFGGVQAILPVVEASLRDTRFSPCVYAQGRSAELYDQAGIRYDALDWQNDEQIQGWTSILNETTPDLIVMGKSVPLHDSGMTPEKYLSFAARSLNLPRIVVLDSWGNYLDRFSKDGTRVHEDYCPEYVCALDELSKQMLVDSGVCSQSIRVTHNPALDSLATASSSRTQETCQDIREDAFNFLFVSQPTREKGGVATHGFDQEILFRHLIAGIERVKLDRPVHVIVWPHPKESEVDWHAAAKAQSTCFSCTVGIDRSPAIFRHIDGLFTFHSTVVYQALYFDTPCWSLMLDAAASLKNPLITNNLGLSRLVLDSDQLDKAIRDTTSSTFHQRHAAACRKARSESVFFSDGNATERVMSVLEEAVNKARSQSLGSQPLIR